MTLKEALNYFNLAYSEGLIDDEYAERLLNTDYREFVRIIKVMAERGDYEADRAVDEAKEYYYEG